MRYVFAFKHEARDLEELAVLLAGAWRAATGERSEPPGSPREEVLSFGPNFEPRHWAAPPPALLWGPRQFDHVPFPIAGSIAGPHSRPSARPATDCQGSHGMLPDVLADRLNLGSHWCLIRSQLDVSIVPEIEELAERSPRCEAFPSVRLGWHRGSARGKAMCDIVDDVLLAHEFQKFAVWHVPVRFEHF